jgi:hypothetical protein
MVRGRNNSGTTPVPFLTCFDIATVFCGCTVGWTTIVDGLTVYFIATLFSNRMKGRNGSAET